MIVDDRPLKAIVFTFGLDLKSVKLKLSTQQCIDPIKWNATAGRLKVFSGLS